MWSFMIAGRFTITYAKLHVNAKAQYRVEVSDTVSCYARVVVYVVHYGTEMIRRRLVLSDTP